MKQGGSLIDADRGFFEVSHIFRDNLEKNSIDLSNFPDIIKV